METVILPLSCPFPQQTIFDVQAHQSGPVARLSQA